MFLSHRWTHTFIYTENPHPEGPQREGEKWLLSFSSFNWGSAAFSVTEPRRGGHQTKEKPFTLYCLLPQRAHLSFSHSILLSIYVSHVPPHILFISHCGVHVFLYFIEFDILATPCKLDKNTQNAKKKNKTRRRTAV